jgi:hypothetical protein
MVRPDRRCFNDAACTSVVRVKAGEVESFTIGKLGAKNEYLEGAFTERDVAF